MTGIKKIIFSFFG